MSEDLQQRLAAVEDALQRAQNQIGALTRRVYQLETGAAAIPEPPPLVQPQTQTQIDVATGVDVEKAATDTDWEATLGTNWLNRIGIILLVIGIALFLGYAMASMGPGGKIAIGAIAGATLLAAGYFYEHRGNFRPFSLGMLAGGFAVLYATAYAAHAVEASRIFDNLYLGVSLQTLIALAGVWQAVRLRNERAAGLALFAAFVGLSSSPSLPFLYGAAYPLALSGLWLSHHMQWRNLPWGILVYTWFCELQILDRDWEFAGWGRPIAWTNLVLFSAFEARERLSDVSWRNPVWILLNTALFLFATFSLGTQDARMQVANIFGLLTLLGLVSSGARDWLGVRFEASSETLALGSATIWAIARFGESDLLLMLMLILAFSMVALFRNRATPAIALELSSQVLLALAALATFAVFPDSRLLSRTPFRVHLALPQTWAVIVCLFAAGRWLTVTPWPSWMALAGIALVTLVTIPKTMGTIILALEAILAIGAGLYLSRRPIRLGGIALFLFCVLKVFVYDMSELDTLPRIFSFVVLGLMLIGASWAYTKYRQQLQKYL